jgi:uncharacterized protein DUF4252
MKNQCTGALFVLLCFLFAITACQKSQTSPTLESHEKKYPTLKKKYIYQSLIRLANIKKDPAFEKLIKDVDKIILYFPPEGDSTYQIKDVKQGLRTDGYETLIDVRTAEDQRMSLWVKETGKLAHYIALMDAEEDLILEIDGQLNIEYLSALQMADQESLMNLIKG